MTIRFASAVRQHRSDRLDDAEKLYRAVLTGNPKHIGALQNLGLVGLQTNRPLVAVEAYGAALALDERKPDWHCNLALALRALGRLDDAVRHCRQAIELAPGRVDAHLTLANILAQQGRSGEAAVSYRQALALKPDIVEARHNLAVALMAQGQFEEALAHFQQALALNPNLTEARLNIGNLCLARGRFAEAVTHYERGLASNANFPKAQHSLGLALAKLGRFAEAIPRFEQAITLRPDFGDAVCDLARTLFNLGRAEEALRVLVRAIDQHGAPEAKGLFVQFLREHRGPMHVDDLPGLLVRALSEPWARPSKVGLVAAPLLRNDVSLRGPIARAASAWPRRLPAPELWGESGLAAMLGHRLLGTLLRTALVCDVALERFLTNVRCALLDAALTAGVSVGQDEQVRDAQILEFACALAQQCFLNEYVYACTDEELGRVHRLRNSLTLAISSGAAIPALQLAAVASYVPLHTLPGAAGLPDRTWPAAVTRLLDCQVREPLEERQLSAIDPGDDRDRGRGIGRGAPAIRGEPLSALGEMRAGGQAAQA